MRLHPPHPALFALLLAGCADDRLPTAPPAATPAEAHVRAVLDCTAAVRESVLRCREAAAPAGILPVILGGQGTYVRMANGETIWMPAIGIFQTDVTVQNLVTQPLGTPDGETATGIRVFFSSLPVATRGTGTVRVDNPDGIGIFTAAGQPYFGFPQIAWPGQTTAARPWRFRVDPGVEAFSFQVLVEARIPAEGGVLRWTARTPCTGCAVHSLSALGGVVFGASTQQTNAPPNSMRILRSGDGGVQWTETVWPAPPLDEGCSNPDAPYVHMGSVWPVNEQVVYAAYFRVHATCMDSVELGPVHYGGVLRSIDGGRTWPAELAPHDVWDELMARSMWGSSETDLYVAGTVGFGSLGRILHTTDGFQTYTVHDAGRDLPAVWGSGPDDVYAVGMVGADLMLLTESRPLCGPDAPGDPPAGVAGLVLHSRDGGTTWQETRFAGLALTGIWGTGDGHLWAVGAFLQGRYHYHACAAIVQSADGGRTWNQTVMPSVYPLTGVWGSGPGAVYAVGRHGTVFLFNGRTWTPLGGFAAPDLLSITGTGAGAVVAAGSGALQGTR